jgi:hypothetical protein
MFGLGHNGFRDAQNRKGVLVHPKLGVRALFGLDVASQSLELA